MEQVIANLLTNALKYGDGKPVSVSVSVVEAPGGQRARLSVRDQGPGIGAENLERIFQRFERAVSAASISGLGLGLGLFISREIVEAHRGSIRVESALGQGSNFIVELPVSPRS